MEGPFSLGIIASVFFEGWGEAQPESADMKMSQKKNPSVWPRELLCIPGGWR